MRGGTAVARLDGEGLRLLASTGSGHDIIMDSAEDRGGPRPAELLLVAQAGCTAMDVVSILRRERQPFTSYEVRVAGDQREDPPPHVFERIRVVHVVEGPVDPEAVRRAIELSATKQCTVSGNLAAYLLRTPDDDEQYRLVAVTGPIAAALRQRRNVPLCVDRRLCSRSIEEERLSPNPLEPEVIAMPARPMQPDLANEVWRDMAKQSFAVVAHINDEGEPRSSGVVYAMVGHRLYVAVAPYSWKARALQTGDQVSVTVPVRRGGLLSLLFPIPPATISFHAGVTVHPAGSITRSSLPKELRRLLPEPDGSPICMLELTPEGQFLTYGVGVSLTEMRNPAIAGGHVPTA